MLAYHPSIGNIFNFRWNQLDVGIALLSVIGIGLEEVEGQVVVKADKRDLLVGRRAPPVLKVRVKSFRPWNTGWVVANCYPYS